MLRAAALCLSWIAGTACQGASSIEPDDPARACGRGDPEACDALAGRYASRARGLREQACDAGDASACARLTRAIPFDLPMPGDPGLCVPGDERPVLPVMVLAIALGADGRTSVDGRPVDDDEAILSLARAARAKDPEIRAVIRADRAVPHGRVIHVMDLAKQGGIPRFAFAVVPATP